MRAKPGGVLEGPAAADGMVAGGDLSLKTSTLHPAGAR
jgi:hypothetical protein